MWIKKLLSYKTNLFGVLAIAIVCSVTTVLAQNWLNNDFRKPANMGQSVPLAAGPDVLKCNEGVYSPVQKTCVSKAVFDEEMKRLFAALGLDSSIYEDTSRQPIALK